MNEQPKPNISKYKKRKAGNVEKIDSEMMMFVLGLDHETDKHVFQMIGEVLRVHVLWETRN